jgi:CheY-like chemotaxis protein
MSTSDQKRTILCVDDQPLVLKARQWVLELAGYSVLTATNAPEGMELFRHERVDLVLTDHLLPGESGSDLAIEMKRLRPEIPIAMLSGLADRPEDATAADMFLTKGMPVPEFLAAVASLLGGAGCQSLQPSSRP